MSGRMKEKGILCCGKCGYFPVRQEWERYFLNSNTYKCPVCQQLIMFDKDLKTLLDRQILFLESQQNITVQLRDVNSNKAVDSNDFQENNDRQCLTVIILIEENEEYFEGFYLNPINGHLKNGFNIDKEQALKSHSHPFFSFNHQFMMKNFSNFYAQNNCSFRLGRRKVIKIEHILYCLDDYIQLSAEQLIGQLDNDSEKNNLSKEKRVALKYEIWKVVKDKRLSLKQDLSREFQLVNNQILSSPHNASEYKLTQLIKFDYTVYKQIIKISEQTDEQQVKKHTDESYPISGIQSQKVIQFKQQINAFYNQLYSTHLNRITLLDQLYQPLQSFISTFETSSKSNLKFIALLSVLPNFQLIRQIDQFYNKQPHSNASLIQSNLAIHNFYLIPFQNQQMLKENSSSTYPHDQSKAIKVFHDCLYEPFSISGKTSYDVISHTITNSFIKSHGKQIENSLKERVNSQIQNSYVLLFWTQTTKQQNNFDNSKNNIKFIKIISQYQKIFILLEKINQNIKTSIKQSSSIEIKNHQINGIISSLNDYLLKILLKTLSIKKNDQIAFDRLICSCNKQQIFYVFEFDEKMKENFEQIDFLDETVLPQELRGYALTYENEIKRENPFRKATSKVYIVDQFTKNNNFDNEYSDDSDERESL